MILANPNRSAAVLLAAFAVATMPASLLASGRVDLEPQTPQTTPAKPSADIMPPASLPATPSTGRSNSEAQAEAQAGAKTEPPAEHFDVDVTGGEVTIDATNASLNKVMHEVAAKAGIKITGGVSDERIFGHYGPAAPSVILAALLDGTGINMLLVDDKKGASELILTQRIGGPTPPNAAAAEAAEEEERPSSRYVPPTRPFQPPGSFGPGRRQITPPAGPNQSDPSQSSNEPRTPQQIYEQLQNANQQKETTSSSPQ